MFLASLKLMPCYYQVDIVGETPFNQVFPVIRWLAVAWGLTCCYNNYSIIINTSVIMGKYPYQPYHRPT